MANHTFSAQTSPSQTSTVPQIPNRLLNALPPDEYRRLLPHFETVPLKLKVVLHNQGETVQHLYFPRRGMCSVMTVMQDGSMVELATIGAEGMAGLPAAMGASLSTSEVMVQISGEADRIPIAAFRREMDRRAALNDLITRYSHCFLLNVMQSAACNALHAVEHRLARWLLTTRDRIGADELPLTQDLLAIMLGVRRPTVTIVSGVLQKAGLIESRHGRIQITKPRELEAASCECYRKVKDECDRLMPELTAPGATVVKRSVPA